MAKKKQKKYNEAQHRAQLLAKAKKQEQLFWLRLQEMAEAVGAGDVLAFLPQKDKELLAVVRLHPVRVEPAEGTRLPGKFVKLIQGMISEVLNSNYFSFPGSDKQFPLADYFTVALTMYHWIITMKDDQHPQHPLFAGAFKPLTDLCEGSESPSALLSDYLDMAGNYLSRPDKAVYFLETTVYSRHYPRMYLAQIITVKTFKPDVASVSFPEGKRPAYLAVFMRRGLYRVSISAGLLSPGSAGADMQLNVYLQKHAMERLQERIDCFPFNIVYLQMCESFDKPEVLPAGHMRALVSFYFFGMKLGYFVVEARDGLAVVRTFLFLTNDSTPEGQKLQQKIGLQRHDKQYTGLDKLSTFLLTDLPKDEELCRLLREAGCHSLLSCDEHLLEVAKLNKGSRLPTARHIREYLMLAGR